MLDTCQSSKYTFEIVSFKIKLPNHLPNTQLLLEKASSLLVSANAFQAVF